MRDNPSEFANRLHAVLGNFSKGLDANGNPLDLYAISARAGAKAREYRKQIKIGESRTRARTRTARYRG